MVEVIMQVTILLLGQKYIMLKNLQQIMTLN